MLDPYGYLALPPLLGPHKHPKDFGLGKVAHAEVGRLVRRSRVIGYTFVRDEPVIVCATDGLRTKDLCWGCSYYPDAARVRKYVIARWILLEPTMAPAQFQIVLHHELAHCLASTFTPDKKWNMEDTKELSKEGCCPDLDRWSWHIERAMQQLVWGPAGAPADPPPVS